MENTYGAGLFLAPFVVRGFLYQFRFHIHQLLVSACVVHSIHLFLGSFVAAYDFRQSKLLPFFTRMLSTPGMFFFVCLKHLSLIMIDTFLLNPYFTTSPVF